jgi:biopolymer transport protein TolQ
LQSSISLRASPDAVWPQKERLNQAPYLIEHATLFRQLSLIPLGALCYGSEVGKIFVGLRENVILLFTTVVLIDLGNILEQTGWVARGVLGLLLLFSIISWAMILQKLGLFSRIRRESDQFLRIFRATRGVANPQALASAGSPFASVYAAGYRELQSQVGSGPSNPHPPKIKSLQAVTVNMQLAAAEEVRRAEKGMSWLATTGSVSPFIGLFGTVWGIIDAFSGLGNAGSASLRAVAPGISEALLTTAAGLFAAIPAVIFYNQFLNNIKNLAQRLDTFALEVAAQIEKTFS